VIIRIAATKNKPATDRHKLITVKNTTGKGDFKNQGRYTLRSGELKKRAGNEFAAVAG